MPSAVTPQSSGRWGLGALPASQHPANSIASRTSGGRAWSLFWGEMTALCKWHGSFANVELEALHADGFDHEPTERDWVTQLHQHSLGWVCARQQDRLVGFVNVAWDGGSHAFILDYP